MRRLQNPGLPIAGLGRIEQTLLIPLAARALARRLFPRQSFADPTAEAIAARINYDLAQFEADRDMMWGLVERSLVLDDLLRRFLSRHPSAQVLSLGSGLSTQFERIDNGRLHWIDVDLPKVADLRQALFPPHPRRRLVHASVTDTGWTAKLGRLRGPTFVVAEGLLMYLDRAQVLRLGHDLAVALRGGPAEFAYDYYCAQMVGQAWLNLSLRRLGAEFKWGMASPEELSLGEPRWRLIDTYPVMERLGWPYNVLWTSFRFFAGVRPYGIAHLQLSGSARPGARSKRRGLPGDRDERPQPRARR
ncbi:MAG: class I SAM-dependent methyltransferase [Pseudomonadota bacterium]|nr:class I SAM-dependent methyltransferase [Pseudomonadota bacterium]